MRVCVSVRVNEYTLYDFIRVRSKQVFILS